MLVWICRLPLPLGVWEGLRFVVVALPGLFSYFFSMRTLGKANHEPFNVADRFYSHSHMFVTFYIQVGGFGKP